MNNLNQTPEVPTLGPHDYEQLMIATAAGTYKGIRYLDLETEQGIYIYFENNRIRQKSLGDWTTWLKAQSVYVHPDDFGALCTFLNPERLRGLKEDISEKLNYRSQLKNEEGYHRTYSSTLSVTHISGKKTAVMTTIDSTDTVINEMRQKQLLLSAASIYISMHILDLENDNIEKLLCPDHIDKLVNGRAKGVSKVLTDVMMQITDDEYLEDMLDFINLRTLDERMDGLHTITLEYLSKYSGWCRARFIAVDWDELGSIRRVLWAVENINVEKKKSNQLVFLSETDLMTGVRNRGAGEQKIRELLDNDHAGAFFLIDVDKFKTINDTYGHTVGDKVLISIANCMRDSFRESDVIMRLGGDEFSIFTPGITDRTLAIGLVKRLFHRVEHICIPELNGHKISVSVGIAFKQSDDHLDFDTLYHNADICTYESKKARGNKFSIFETV